MSKEIEGRLDKIENCLNWQNQMIIEIYKLSVPDDTREIVNNFIGDVLGDMYTKNK